MTEPGWVVSLRRQANAWLRATYGPDAVLDAEISERQIAAIEAVAAESWHSGWYAVELTARCGERRDRHVFAVCVVEKPR